MPISIVFNGFVELTPAMASNMINQAFMIDYDTVTVAEATVILHNINLIQENLVGRTLHLAHLWRQCQHSYNVPLEEAFPWCAPGTTMLLSLLWVKMTLFAKVHPNQEYRASILDTAVLMDSILRLTNSLLDG
jgi:type IV secretory pathway ATPase VirB11/archaellum biosynthesis ATPase